MPINREEVHEEIITAKYNASEIRQILLEYTLRETKTSESKYKHRTTLSVISDDMRDEYSAEVSVIIDLAD